MFSLLGQSVQMPALFGFLGSLGAPEVLLLLVLGVLLFGRKLPELGRSMGKTFVEFKKGVKGLEDEVESAGNPTAAKPGVEPEAIRPPQRVTPSAPKFDDVPAAPKDDLDRRAV